MTQVKPFFIFSLPFTPSFHLSKLFNCLITFVYHNWNPIQFPSLSKNCNKDRMVIIGYYHQFEFLIVRSLYLRGVFRHPIVSNILFKKICSSPIFFRDHFAVIQSNLTCFDNDKRKTKRVLFESNSSARSLFPMVHISSIEVVLLGGSSEIIATYLYLDELWYNVYILL